METNHQLAILLRFRDLVTEPGGNIAEHRKIIRQQGYAWWGWWARQRETVPREVFELLFPTSEAPTEIVLFDSGSMQLYRTVSHRIVVSPSRQGINSPDFEATPDYYVRGRYPAWFRFDEDIVPMDIGSLSVAARPTLDQLTGFSTSNLNLKVMDLVALRDDGPTLWVIAATGLT